MRFLPISRFIETSPLRLLDGACLLVMLPLLLVIKVPMLLYMLLVFSLLFFRKRATGLTLFLTALAGVLALFLSLYGAFNFSGLSRLKLFVELLIYLLVIAVSLQRLTREINFYLIISPILLMALSLFFFHSISMLLYVLVEIFVLLWLILLHRMDGHVSQSLRMAALYFVSSLPWVVLLFLFFPRISFEHAAYGFRGDEVRRMGHDGTMYLDSKALLVPSERIVMEVSFAQRLPAADQLYFRGSLLYVDRGDHWEPLPRRLTQNSKPVFESAEQLSIYNITLYPTQKRWLYLLDLPYEAPKGATIDADFMTTVPEKIDTVQHYEATSSLRYRYGRATSPAVVEAASRIDVRRNPRSYALAQQIAQRYPDMQQRADAMAERFRAQALRYTLQPKPLDLHHSVDSFLFDKREGYCVHFAASFVLFARMAGVPARVITGYKGDLANSVKNYLIIKEKDAHAWAELLIDGAWQRVETTAFASKVSADRGTQSSQDDADTQGSLLLKKINLYLMYIKYEIETWILHYSHFRQMQLLEEARKNPGFLLKFLLAIVLLLLLVIVAIRVLRRPSCSDRVLCTMRPLLAALRKQGYEREDGETMHAFLCRYLDDFPQCREIAEIDRLYERIRYGGEDTTGAHLRLQEEIRLATIRSGRA